MTEKEIIEELEKLKDHMLQMNNEEYKRYGAGISYSIGWLKSWLSLDEKVKQLIKIEELIEIMED